MMPNDVGNFWDVIVIGSGMGGMQGGFYGIDVTPQRVMSDALRALTPIEGLYLAGQDVACPGIPGALWGGLLAAASYDSKVLKPMRG